jgi:LysR family glycine cleavage system transcriptional activator
MGRGGYCDLTEKKIYDDNLIFVASPKLLVGIDKDDPKQVFGLP